MKSCELDNILAQETLVKKIHREESVLDGRFKEDIDKYSDFYLSPVREQSQTQIECSPERRKHSSFKDFEMDVSSLPSHMQSPNPKHQISCYQKHMRSKIQNLFKLEGKNFEPFNIKRSVSVEKVILESSSEQQKKNIIKKQFISDKIIPKKDKKIQLHDCNCSKSKCLKLYCKCFQNGFQCGEECSCVSCYNNEQFQNIREQAIKELIEINPFAFKPKYKKLNTKDIQLHSRGCTCSKSGCIKNYCECYSGGVGCSDLCQCKNCQNQKSQINEEEKKNFKQKGIRKKKKSTISELFHNDSLKTNLDNIVQLQVFITQLFSLNLTTLFFQNTLSFFLFFINFKLIQFFSKYQYLF